MLLTFPPYIRLLPINAQGSDRLCDRLAYSRELGWESAAEKPNSLGERADVISSSDRSLSWPDHP